MTRWEETDGPRGAEYARRWDELAARGVDPHGEVAFVERVLHEYRPELFASGATGADVLDAGCGTGRVAAELARRGYAVVGVDLDREMLATARTTAPELPWLEVDLVALDALDDSAWSAAGAPAEFDAIILAGNVMIFLAPGSERRVVANLRDRLRPGGLLMAGFQFRGGGYGESEFTADLAAAGIILRARFSTWGGAPTAQSDDYGVFLGQIPE